ncbi:MAG: DUF116 domain-containing protein [Clostridiales bacterium]|nr:DUF116 domain-containing protein [Clostridiales bacterium]
MDKRTRQFISYAALLLLLIIILTSFFAFIYSNFSIKAYNTVLKILMALFAVMAVFVVVSMLSVLNVYRKRKMGKGVSLFVRAGLGFIVPFSLFLAQLFKKDRDAIRSFYIDINNIISEAPGRFYKPSEILVILPHCLQNSECGYKITNDINNCRQCGKCVIGSVLEVVRERGIRTLVVTGGTAARNTLVKEKPRILLTVACERDLASGIMDVAKMPAIVRMPVIGILNERPNGPCFNTQMDAAALAEKLDKLLDTRKSGLEGRKD